MKKIILVALALLTIAAPAQASWWRKSWQWHPKRPAIAHVNNAGMCPFDGPEKAYTIVNAGVTGVTLQQLGAVMQATRDESFALRMYYGTPCAWFGAGGKPIYLSNGSSYVDSGGATHYSIGGVHYPSAIYVETGLTPASTWVRAFSHEVMEDLVDPTDNRFFGNYFAEVCDPVENWTYPVDGMGVSDFVTPHYYLGGPGPYDAASRLEGPA